MRSGSASDPYVTCPPHSGAGRRGRAALRDTSRIYLFGHSMAALLAFELAHELTARGRPPVRLLVSGYRAPQLSGRRRGIHLRADAGLLAHLRQVVGTQEEILAHPTCWPCSCRPSGRTTRGVRPTATSPGPRCPFRSPLSEEGVTPAYRSRPEGMGGCVRGAVPRLGVRRRPLLPAGASGRTPFRAGRGAHRIASRQ
ncbi:thioesterase II family protein [Streptomyces sp. NPDC007983]|uniref:thioesterase II family protein n=1 Tax=Streptomyces sp. NPDC007983 TaxID=3364800 RepID=UPI0036E7FC59